jgi:hypothetical protein
MSEKKRTPRRYVVCMANKGNEASLERDKLYVALSDPKAEAEGLLRVIDEEAEDYLYPAEWFAPSRCPGQSRTPCERRLLREHPRRRTDSGASTADRE